jgi:phosphoribosylanthranilate isomerase
MNVEAKICGINARAALDAAIQGGAAYVGFVFYPPSPRSLTPDEAAPLARAAADGARRVGLFVDPTDADLASTVGRVPLDLLQLHGRETPDRVGEIRRRFGLPVMKAFQIASATDLDAAAPYFGIVDRLLFDAKPPKDMKGALPGGNAVSFDWRLLAGRTWPVPWMLSGGLDSRLLACCLKRAGVTVEPLTFGNTRDTEMQLATQVAESLGLKHRLADVPPGSYPELAAILARWEHCAAGFNGVESWGFAEHLRAGAPKNMVGFALDVVYGGAFPKMTGVPVNFDTLWRQQSPWALDRTVVEQLLRKAVFRSLVDEILEDLRRTYENYSESETKRVLSFKLYHRQRFHIGGHVWRTSFGAWPVVPAADTAVLDVAAGVPPTLLSNRRAQKDLLVLKFPALARIPLDNNSHRPELLVPSLKRLGRQYLADRTNSIARRVGFPRPRAERRYYYRVYDFNGPGWQAVRAMAEPYRDLAADIFDMDVFNTLLPRPGEVVQFRDGIIDASSRKTLVGLLLAAGRGSITLSPGR